jgi:hypothetical protein
MPYALGAPARAARAPASRACAPPPPRAAAPLPPPAPGPRRAGPGTPPPSYAAIDAAPLNRLVYLLFRAKMAAQAGGDSPLPGYGAVIDLTRRLAAGRPPAAARAATRAVLRSLFPSWLPGAFAALFAHPFPGFSARLNALATAATCEWLMGPCAVVDVELDTNGTVGVGHGVRVERCRYLEEAGCAAVCLNACKAPTQAFFAEDMGLPLTMTPNYDTFECVFAFGRAPPPPEEDEAYKTACFTGCAAASAGGGSAPRAGEGERCPGAAGA